MNQCPYSKDKMKKFSAFNRENDTTLDTNLSTETSKRGMILEEDESHCPYKKGIVTEADKSKCLYNTKQIEDTKCSVQNETSEDKCPYSQSSEENKESKKEEEKDDSDDDTPKGGCPVKNTGN